MFCLPSTPPRPGLPAAPLILVLVMLPGLASADRLSCWESQSSHIVAKSDRFVLGNFEVSGSTRDLAQPDAMPRRFKCTGSYLAEDIGKKYNYYCEITMPGGDEFLIQNSDARSVGKVRFAGGSGAFQDASGPAPEYEGFPVNTDGSLPSCKSGGCGFEMP